MSFLFVVRIESVELEGGEELGRFLFVARFARLE